MTQRRLKAAFMRGGTSKAVMFRREDLPENVADWDGIFLAVMGSPDPYGRQLDGMGGGISSLSKVCVVGPASHPLADVDYTFAQVMVDEAKVDYGGNCGNMSAAVGHFALEEGFIEAPANGQAQVRIHNTNTGKIIRATFDIDNGEPATDGRFSIDGVAGTSAPVRLDFIEPGGSRTGFLLPTSYPLDRLSAGGRAFQVSLVDAANPCVFVRSSDVRKSGTETAEELENDRPLMLLLETIRRQASVMSGLAGSSEEAALQQSVPKIAMVFGPAAHGLASGKRLAADDFDIGIRMISMGRPHRAVPITGAVCLAVALRIEGTLPQIVARPNDATLRIAHPSGVLAVDAAVSADENGRIVADYGSVYRTARRLFDGHVFYR